MNHVHFDAVYPVPVVPLLSRLTDLILSQILSGKDLGVDPVSNATPHSDFHLIVCIIGSGIKDEN